MKKLILSFVGLFMSTSIALAADQPNILSAQQNAIAGHVSATPTSPTADQLPVIIPPAPDINARGYVLMDANSGQIIASKNMHEKMPPASLTKLMTLYIISQAVAQGQVSLDDKVRVSKLAWQRGGSRMFLKLGSHVPLRDLIEGIIVASGNDACVAAAQYIAGNEKSFAQLMNQTAQRLGMKDSHYADSTGLPNPDHYSTPYDMAILTRHIINDFPQDYGWYKQKWIKWNGIRQPNRNRLLWRDPSADGLKTGHTKAAGYCLISSAKRDGMRLISVVMGTPTDAARANDSQSLLNWGFRFYESHKLFSANTAITTPRVWLGKSSEVPMGVNQDLWVTIPRGQFTKLNATTNLPKKLNAPIQQGQAYGKVIVTLNNKTVTEAPLVALKNDPRGGFFSRLGDHIAMFFKSIF